MQPWRWNSNGNQHDDHVKTSDARLGLRSAILQDIPQQTTMSLLAVTADANFHPPVSLLGPSRPHSDKSSLSTQKVLTSMCTYWINNIAYKCDG